MKKLLSLSIFTAYSVMGLAQLPVGTSPENKNAVLEEFTGIHCVFCPDGHLKANQFSASNPGDVVLINIHTGSFATPAPGEPDFRTPWGSAIAGQTNLTGYPAGSINRREFPGTSQNSAGGTAQSRGSWAATGATVISEPSYANIAVEGNIDYATNTLTVDVETYFTAAAPGTTVNLNVAVLQDHLVGPQTGASANPAQVLPGGMYEHGHMLRHLMTGQWGVSIPTAMSTVGTYQYTWVLPADINGVPVVPTDLEVAAFITETQQNIVTGANGPVTFTLPTGVSSTDLEATSPKKFSGYCLSTITPEFTIKNNESFAVDSVEAILEMNGNTPVKQWVTNIAANGSKVVTFPAQTLSPGTNTVSYSASVNGVFKYFDGTTGNNRVNADEINVIPQVVNNFPTGVDFETAPAFGLPSDLLVEDQTGRIYVVDQGVTAPPLPNKIGGYAQSNKCIRFDFITIDPNTISSLITEKVSLQGGKNSEVQFDVAYAVRGNFTGDQLSAYISTDCGATWIRMYQETGGNGLETGQPTASNARFYPQAASDWKTINAFIPDADGAQEVIFKIEGKSAGGNSLYFDNLMIDGKPIGLAEFSNLKSSIYPNPATDLFFVEMEENADFTVKVSNALGQVVSSSEFTNTNKAEINTAEFAAGVYIINIRSDKGTSSKKITVTK